MRFHQRVTSAPSDGVPAAPAPGTVVVPVPVDAVARDALTARLAALTAVRHPHLVSVLDAQTVRPGAVDVVLARGEAADLLAVLAVRGRLAPGEASAVGVNVAQALAALHAAGLVHGSVEPADVVLRGGGAPALRPRVTTPPEEWTPAEDVRALARLVDGLLGSRAAPGTGDPVLDPEGALRNALAPALAADGRRRPEAGTLAALVDAACEPADLRLPDPATLAAAALTGTRRSVVGPVEEPGAGSRPSARPRRPAETRPLRTRRPVPRVALVIVGVGLAVGLMTGAALQLRPGAEGAEAGASGPPAAEPTTSKPAPVASAAPATSPAPEPTPDAVLDRSRAAEAAAALTQRRLDLLAGTAADVGTVDVAGSPAHDADFALLAQLAEAGTRPVDPRATVTSTEVVAEDGTRVRVRVEYAVEAHAQQAPDGTTTQVPASPPQVSTLALLWTSQGWRVEGVA